MLTKFEAKTSRVKCIAFHPKRSWVLVSMHNGQAQLWDYQLKSLIGKYQDHDGPVRACTFHPSQPLFATGGDDGKIRVYNYRQKRHLFTLTGHVDYIRSLSFHPGDLPWLMSASDDQTIRIWNWQSRTCVTTLTGHTHYVMCAQFHPKEDLVVSASLDNTIRIWDVFNVRKKSAASRGSSGGGFHSPRSPAQIELFSSSEGHVKFVLEGHDRGVNWVMFHPTKPLIVSGSDDRTIKLWRFNEVRAWEFETLKGHSNNVSCVLFTSDDKIVSASEDKTIRVWDYSSRKNASPIHVFKKENERYWTISGRLGSALLAAGHDNGFMVFKLERERPAFCLADEGTIFYNKANSIYCLNLRDENPKESELIGLEKPISPGSICYYSPSEQALLISGPKGFDLIIDGKLVASGPGTNAVFIGRNRFLTVNLEDHSILEIRGLDGNTSKTIKAPFSVRKAFPAIAGSCILADSKGKGCIFDLTQGRILEFELPKAIHYVFWSPDMSAFAAASKHDLQLYDRTSGGSFEMVIKYHEISTIKGGCWDGKIFFYNTETHLKYLLNINHGDSGIVCSLAEPLYLIKVESQYVFLIDRKSIIQVNGIDTNEFKFKLALRMNDMATVKAIIDKGALVGQAIIEYLRNNGFAHIALHFVSDPPTRFTLAMDSNRLDIASKSIKTFSKDVPKDNERDPKKQKANEMWEELAEKAMSIGDVVIAEEAWRQIKNYDKLSFLFVISGQFDKLKELTDNEIPKDKVDLLMVNRLYIGDYEGIAKMLQDTPDLSVLAYLAALRSGNDNLAREIKQKSCSDSSIEVNPVGNLPGLIPIDPTTGPLPISKTERDDFWSEPPEIDEIAKHFEQNLDLKVNVAEVQEEMNPGANGWEVEDLEIPDVEPPSPVVLEEEKIYESEYQSIIEEEEEEEPKTDYSQSRIPFIQVAIGETEKALELLEDQVGLKDPSTILPMVELIGREAVLPDGSLRVDTFGEVIPVITKSSLRELMERGWELTTAGKFDEALKSFRQCLRSILFAKARNQDEAEEMLALVPMCRDYILGLTMDLKRRKSADMSPTVALELACYFASLKNLLSEHRVLALRSAMSLAYKQQCLKISGILAEELLKEEPPQEVTTQVSNNLIFIKASKISALANQKSRHQPDALEIEFESQVPFDICAATFRPIYPGSSVVKSPFTQTCYKPDHAPEICVVSEFEGVGAAGSGLVIFE